MAYIVLLGRMDASNIFFEFNINKKYLCIELQIAKFIIVRDQLILFQLGAMLHLNSFKASNDFCFLLKIYRSFNDTVFNIPGMIYSIKLCHPTHCIPKCTLLLIQSPRLITSHSLLQLLKLLIQQHCFRMSNLVPIHHVYYSSALLLPKAHFIKSTFNKMEGLQYVSEYR